MSFRHTASLSLALILALVAALGFVALQQDEPFDVLIRAGTVYDGTGAPGRRADVGVRGDRIAVVSDLSRARQDRRRRGEDADDDERGAVKDGPARGRKLRVEA